MWPGYELKQIFKKRCVMVFMKQLGMSPQDKQNHYMLHKLKVINRVFQESYRLIEFVRITLFLIK